MFVASARIRHGIKAAAEAVSSASSAAQIEPALDGNSAATSYKRGAKCASQHGCGSDAGHAVAGGA